MKDSLSITYMLMAIVLAVVFMALERVRVYKNKDRLRGPKMYRRRRGLV